MQMPRRERDKAIMRVHGTTIRVLPHRVYLAVPTLPRLERSLIYMGSSRQWLFVFRDNSSYESLHVHIDMEDVRAVKKFLGVEHERAQWYYVMVGWCVVLLPLCAFSSNLSLSCICRSIDISIPGNIDIHHPVLSVVPKAMSVLHLFVRSCWLMPIFAGYRYAFICTCILRMEFGLRSL